MPKWTPASDSNLEGKLAVLANSDLPPSCSEDFPVIAANIQMANSFHLSSLFMGKESGVGFFHLSWINCIQGMELEASMVEDMLETLHSQFSNKCFLLLR